jgi:phage protein D
MAPDDGAVQSSRPTIVIDGQESASLTGGQLHVRVREDVHGLYDCELELGNWGPNGGTDPNFLYFDRKTIDFGKQLTLNVANQPIFSGRITGIEARYPEGDSPSLTVLAEDRFQDLRMTRRTRTFTSVSDGDVAKRVAGEHGLKPDVGVDGPTYTVLAQLNQSDLAFLRERARSLDAELWITDTTLSMQPRTKRVSTPLTLTYGKELREFRALADVATQATSVEVTGWDVAGKTAIDEKADDSVLGSELQGGDSGPSVLRSAFGERKDVLATAVPQTSAEAKARAGALLKRRARRFVVGTGTAQTQSGLRVGATVSLVGLGPLFEGNFYVSAVTHLYDGAGGLRTELTVERPGLGRPS